MKLDATDLRYLAPDGFRVLTAVCFPTELCDRPILMIAAGRNGVQKPRGGANSVDCTNF